MHNLTADIAEIFSSIQGEGVFVGAKQIFVRFRGCNLSCSFCDEARNAGSKPYSHTDLLSEIKFLELSKGPHHSVSFTGGEPLLQHSFLARFLPALRKERIRCYLETNGTLPVELKRVIDFVDIIAMDIKLPSSTGGRPFWDEHISFLKMAARKKVFVKAVVTQRTTKRDIERAFALVREVGQEIPFIIQPAAPVGEKERRIGPDALLEFMELGTRRRLTNIRVIPQIHKVLNIK